MKSITLKRELINTIAGIEDIDLLKAIKAILEHQKSERHISIPTEIEKELFAASKEVNSGLYTTQEDLDKKVESWLKEG